MQLETGGIWLSPDAACCASLWIHTSLLVWFLLLLLGVTRIFNVHCWPFGSSTIMMNPLLVFCIVQAITFDYKIILERMQYACDRFNLVTPLSPKWLFLHELPVLIQVKPRLIVLLFFSLTRVIFIAFGFHICQSKFILLLFRPLIVFNGKLWIILR